jgi:hypothetical protein
VRRHPINIKNSKLAPEKIGILVKEKSSNLLPDNKTTTEELQ